MNITFSKKPTAPNAPAILPIVSKNGKADIPAILDKAATSFIKTAADNTAGSEGFSAKSGAALSIYLPKSRGSNNSALVALLLGLGALKDLSALELQDAGGKLYLAAKALGHEAASLYIPAALATKTLKASEIAAHLAYGFKLRAYTFEQYKTKANAAKKAGKAADKRAKAPKTLKTLNIVIEDKAAAEKAFAPLKAVAEGVFTARDLVNEPPNMLYPESYAKRISVLLKPLGVGIEILDEKKMLKMSMGALMAVGQGSERPPRMVIMRWEGAAKSRKPLMLIGKGVTFDTGGISLKPGAGMEEMKMDMGGSAAVVGAMQALALRKAKANVIGIVGLVENMPAHNAYRPSDIVTSYSGQTIEVLNTDAEGRLVLADCLTYGQEIAKPDAIIDLATLTGAIMVALGHEYCGTFVNTDKLWQQLETACTRTGEKLWRMPLDEVYKKDMEGTFADIQNLGKSGRMAGACTAAGFLSYFVNEGTPWAHLDIAGTAWIKSDKPTVPKYASGFGVRLLNQLVADHYE